MSKTADSSVPFRFQTMTEEQKGRKRSCTSGVPDWNLKDFSGAGGLTKQAEDISDGDVASGFDWDSIKRSKEKRWSTCGFVRTSPNGHALRKVKPLIEPPN